MACNCPPGYEYIESTNKCQLVETATPIPAQTNYDLCAGATGTERNGYGTRFYADITDDTIYPKPIQIADSPTVNLVATNSTIVPLIQTVTTDPWDSEGDPTKGRLNRAGIWSCGPGGLPCDGSLPDCLPVETWVGLTTCVNIPETKTYCIGISADNYARFKVNGTTIVEINGQYFYNTQFNFYYHHVVQFTLQAGLNIITLEGLNRNDVAIFCGEIYNATPAQLAGMNLAQLEDPNVLIFSTKNYIGGEWELSEFPNNEPANIGYTCPPGYQLANCDGNLQCVKITQINADCGNDYKLTDCSNSANVVNVCANLFDYIGHVIKLKSCPDICWKVSTDGDCSTAKPFDDEITADYPPAPTGEKTCVYDIDNVVDTRAIPAGCIASVVIYINGIPYTFPYTTPENLVALINTLDLGYAEYVEN